MGWPPRSATAAPATTAATQLKRLEKIKTLTEDGHPISSLVELSEEQLDARIGITRPRVSPHRLPQIGLVGPNLLILEQEAGDSDRAEINQRWVSIDDFVQSRPAERAQLDVVAVQIPSLNAEVLQRVRNAAPDCRLLAIYQFASREALAHATEQHGATALAWPLTWTDLMLACATPAGDAARAGRTAPRRYTDHELVDIASRARNRGFDAPRHLVVVDHRPERVHRLCNAVPHRIERPGSVRPVTRGRVLCARAARTRTRRGDGTASKSRLRETIQILYESC